MRYIRYIKTEVIASFKQFQGLLMIILTPFFLTLFLAFSMRGIYAQPKLSVDVPLYIENNDQGEYGDKIVLLFQQLSEEKQILLTSNPEEAKFSASIPEGFTKAIQSGSQDSPIVIRRLGRSSNIVFAVYKELFATITTQLLEVNQVARKIEATPAATISKEQVATLLASLQQEIASQAFQMEQVEAEAQLTSAQHFSITGISLLLIMLMEALWRSKVQKELGGYRKRMEILPYSVSEKERLDLATHVIFNTFLILLYILAWKLVDATKFGNNWMGLLLFALFYSLFTGVVATIVGTLITEKNHQMISTLVNMLLNFSSGILPLDKISPVFGFLSGNLVQRFIYTPFVDLMNGASVGDMLPSAAPIICILSFVFVLRIKRKEAQQ